VAEEVREKGREAHSYVVDCSKREEVYRVAGLVRDEVGDVAVLINNAGVFFLGNYVSGELSDEQIEKTFSVNALAHYWTVRAFLPWMVENDYGYIVNVASGAAYVGVPLIAAYCATKAGVASFTETLRYELLHKKGISVSCVYMSFVNTRMMPPRVKEVLIERNTPIARPEDAAQAIVYGMAEKKRDIFVPLSLKAVPFLKAVVPFAALDMLAQNSIQVFEMSNQKRE
jgi:short-subunit dehydrogenase